jgi:uncharacterized LabA/DUF88 family protein
MGRLAIFIDGGYIDKVARDEFAVRPDFGKLSAAVAAEVTARSVEPVELLRTLFYHCPPYQSSTPTPEEAARYGQAQKFFQMLGRLPRYETRLGRLAFRGLDRNGKPIFQQKRVDLLLGLDFAILAGKHQIQHAAVLSGDSDLIPAVEVAKQEGVCTWLVHGPARSKSDGSSTYARELWEAVDERIELTQAFMTGIAR